MWRAVPEACQEDHSHGDSEFIVNQLNIRGCRYVAFKPWPAVSPEENSNRSLPPRSLRRNPQLESSESHTAVPATSRTAHQTPAHVLCGAPPARGTERRVWVRKTVHESIRQPGQGVGARSSAPIRPSAASRRLHRARRIQSMHIPGQVGPALPPLVPSIKCQPRFLPLSLSLSPCGSRRQGPGEREKRGLVLRRREKAATE
jgi:hypothetical protein